METDSNTMRARIMDALMAVQLPVVYRNQYTQVEKTGFLVNVAPHGQYVFAETLDTDRVGTVCGWSDIRIKDPLRFANPAVPMFRDRLNPYKERWYDQKNWQAGWYDAVVGYSWPSHCEPTPAYGHGYRMGTICKTMVWSEPRGGDHPNHS